MSVKKGKYYWVRTELGKEIAFKRDSGAWEMHGIDCTEDLRELILEVYEEVANEFNKKDRAEQLLMHSVNGNSLIEIENAYIEDADTVDNYDVTGRVSKLWITKEDFNNIKCINN